MNAKASLIALSILVASALPLAQADAKPLPKTAYFKVRIGAIQHVEWNEDMTSYSTSCGVAHITGHGTSNAHVGTQDWQPVTAKRVGSQVRFLSPGSTLSNPNPGVTALGTLNRVGEQQGSGTGPANPMCGTPIPTPPDCGDRYYPGDSKIALLWNTPASWSSFDGRRPHSPSLHIRGPYGPSLFQTMSYRNCTGERDDYQLGITTDPTPGVDSGSASLPLAKLFDTKYKRFKVRGGIDGTVPHVTPPGVTGGFYSHLSLLWTVQFKRLAHPGKPDPVKPAPLT